MAEEKQKPSLEEYEIEAVGELGFDELPKAEAMYRFNMQAALTAATKSKEFGTVTDALGMAPSSYLGGNPELLFYPGDVAPELKLQAKGFESVLNKLYRHNVVFNRKYPGKPDSGYWSAADLFSLIDDLLRTRLICRYLDGPQYVCEFLEGICNKAGIENSRREHSNESGYYAWHFYFRVPVELSIAGQIVSTSMWVEIQFSTQLAEVITGLTHDLYQIRREGGVADPFWKWDAKSKRFRSSFIGHGLHLLEGVILTYRDDVLKDRDESKGTATDVEMSVGPEKENG